MQAITKYRWQLLVFLAHLLVVNTEAQKQDHGDSTQNELVDSQNLVIPKTYNTSSTKSNLDPSSMKGNKAQSYLFRNKHE